MSYFGNSGPSQDGGFIAGIGAGAARLNNARATRARHAKSLGTLPDMLSRDGGFSRESDETLSEIAPLYNESSKRYYMFRDSPDQLKKDQAELQYLKDRNLIEDWARNGPYVHEGKAINSALIFGGAILMLTVAYMNRSVIGRKATGRKSAFYGVFS